MRREFKPAGAAGRARGSLCSRQIERFMRADGRLQKAFLAQPIEAGLLLLKMSKVDLSRFYLNKTFALVTKVPIISQLLIDQIERRQRATAHRWFAYPDRP
ncbi:hypothetical protein L596_018543 [Steinernema carpocapsae]|uniref:Uncharacterized protein n=1 Tax=Steinernema carpocapsae TaxID=34508 RepID=A0A4U5N585_STECR|nr:hypothetical protein L596_018543 [Steinernema carpocapsae]